MKVLITGITPLQVNSPKRRNDYRDNTHAMLAAFTELGVECHWGHPRLGWEALRAGSPYDALFVGICDPRAMVANQVYDMAYMLEQYADREAAKQTSVVFYFDDWRVYKCLQGFDWMNRNPERVRNPSFDQRLEMLQRSPDGAEPFIRLLNRLSRPEGWPLATASLFDFGTDAPMLKDKPLPKLQRVNLQAYYPTFDFDDPGSRPALGERKREWMYSALWDYSEWVAKLKTAWGVDEVGPKYARVPEAEFVRAMSTYVGHLSPPYGTANGSGWARPRWWYAAHTRTIVAGDPKELGPWLPSYIYRPEEVEQMSDGELRTLADEQAHEQLAATLTRVEVQRRLVELAYGRAI